MRPAPLDDRHPLSTPLPGIRSYNNQKDYFSLLALVYLKIISSFSITKTISEDWLF